MRSCCWNVTHVSFPDPSTSSAVLLFPRLMQKMFLFGRIADVFVLIFGQECFKRVSCFLKASYYCLWLSVPLLSRSDLQASWLFCAFILCRLSEKGCANDQILTHDQKWFLWMESNHWSHAGTACGVKGHTIAHWIHDRTNIMKENWMICNLCMI